MTESSDNWFSLLEAALAVGQRLVTSKEQFNAGCKHIVSLLRDASTLLEIGSHATAAFLAITALEETSKLHVGMYRHSADPVGRRQDPLYKHDQKHRLAVGPTVAMGSRLQDAVGDARMNELIELATSGKLGRLREASLYVEQTGPAFNIPTEVVTKALSRDLLLLAIEAFDDALVGYTSRSMALGEDTDLLFAKWADKSTEPNKGHAADAQKDARR